jgi:putative transposase
MHAEQKSQRRPSGHCWPNIRMERGRRSIRLRGYDYTQPGAYFVTICTHKNQCPFDDPVLRGVVRTYWEAIPTHATHVTLDAWVVMPNHLHGIIVIEGDASRVGARHSQLRSSLPRPFHSMAIRPSTGCFAGNALPLRRGVPPGSLGAIVGNFKSVSARRINGVRHMAGMRVWQRNYYEHVIRSERALQRIREYIHNNPLRWDLDVENPDNWQGGKTSDTGRYYASIWEE